LRNATAGSRRVSRLQVRQRIPRSRRECGRAHRRARLDCAARGEPGLRRRDRGWPRVARDDARPDPNTRRRHRSSEDDRAGRRTARAGSRARPRRRDRRARRRYRRARRSRAASCESVATRSHERRAARTRTRVLEVAGVGAAEREHGSVRGICGF